MYTDLGPIVNKHGIGFKCLKTRIEQAREMLRDTIQYGGIETFIEKQSSMSVKYLLDGFYATIKLR